MKILILGGGVIGVTSAWYLAEAGHEVIVIDRQHGVGLETSYANAGEISPGYASPWAAPGIPLKALKWLFARHAPLIVRPGLDLAMLRWLAALLANCTEARYLVNKARMMRLAEFSQACLAGLRDQLAFDYDGRQLGTLQLFRDQKQLDDAMRDVAALHEAGIPFEILDPRGCVVVEPGLDEAQGTIAGGLYLPRDETGDCFKFTNALADAARARGVRFLTGRSIERLVPAGGVVGRCETDAGPIFADAFVVALGSYSAKMIAPLGMRLPVYPVKGYSMTLPITDAARAPVSTLLDESYKVAITRLGDRIRVGGMAEICGYDLALPQRRRTTLERSVNTLFGGAGDTGRANFWCGLRPMTPDGTPVIGPTGIPNLFLNTGHGTLGWTMACGSGKIIADMMSGRKPQIRADDLALGRYQAG
jgi:D-amino-acid dehydrogenase